MILALKNGALIPPVSPAAGHKRARALTAECTRIEMQLKDSTRMTRMGDTVVYGDWRRRAEQALRMHNMELRLLREWLDVQCARLMKRATALFEELIADEVEFDGDELLIVEELTAYVRAREDR